MKSLADVWYQYDGRLMSHQMLNDFFLLDLQYSYALVESFEEEILSYLDKELAACGGSGNSYEYECLAEGVQLQCCYPDDSHRPVIIDYTSFLSALSAWKNYCQQLQTNPNC